MRNLFKLGAALCAALVLCGCGTMRRPQAPVSLRPGVLLVVSTFENRMNLQYVGTTVFQNEKKELEVNDWNISGLTESLLAETLKQAGQTTVQLAEEADRATLRGVGADYSSTPVWSLDERKRKVVEVARRHAAGMVLLMAPDRREDIFYGTNQAVSGYGLYERGVVFRSPTYVAYAMAQFVLYDGATGEELNWIRRYQAVQHREAAWPPGNIDPGEKTLRTTRGEMEGLMRALVGDGTRNLVVLPGG